MIIGVQREAFHDDSIGYEVGRYVQRHHIINGLFKRSRCPSIQPGDSFSCQFDIGVSRIKTNSRLWGWTIRRTAADGSTRECYFGENGLLESIAEATFKFDEKSNMRSEAIGKDYEVVYLYDENRNLIQVCENYYVLEDYCRDAFIIWSIRI